VPWRERVTTWSPSSAAMVTTWSFYRPTQSNSLFCRDSIEVLMALWEMPKCLILQDPPKGADNILYVNQL